MTQKVVVIMNFIKAFFQSESAGGISLLSAAILGVLVANSPIAAQYFAVMQIHLGPMNGSFFPLCWYRDQEGNDFWGA